MNEDLKVSRLLEQLPLSHPMTLCTTVSMALLWFFSALPTLSPAFLAPDNDYSSNETKFSSVQVEVSLIPYGNKLQFDLESPVGWLHPGELTSSVYFLGNLVLGQIPCVLADILGRRPVIVFCTFLLGLAGVIAAAAPTFFILLALRFAQGVTFSALIMINWVHCCESLAPEDHKKAAVLFGVLWVLGFVAMAGIARIANGWRIIQFLSSFPSLFFAAFLYWQLPESPAFLATKGKALKLEKFINRANQKKKVPIECDVQETIASLPDRTHENLLTNMKNILQNSRTLLYLGSQMIIWTCDFLMYGAMMLTTGIGFDPYVSFMLSGLAELPSYIMIPYLLDWVGRKPCVIGIHLLSALSYGALLFFPDDSSWWICVWLVAKFGIASAFQCCFVYGVEIFPVENRNICLGVCSTLANLGAFLSPHVDDLGEIFPGGAFAVFSGLCVVCALCTTVLPETSPKTTEKKTSKKKKMHL